MSINLSNDFFLTPYENKLQQLQTMLDQTNTLAELNEFIDFFLNNVSRQLIRSLKSDSTKYLTEIGFALQQKVVHIILSNGLIPEPNYIYLYPFFSEISIDQHSKVSSTLLFLKHHYETLSDKSEYEAIIIKNTIFSLQIINGKAKEGLQNFLELTMLEHLHKSLSVENEWQIVLPFLKDTGIDFDAIYPTLNTIFDLDTMLSLSSEERRSVFNWTLHGLWNVPTLFNHPSWTLLYKKWKIILYALIERGFIEEVMYVQFFIYHFIGNSFQTQDEWKVFTDEISQPCSQMYNKWGSENHLPCPQLKSDQKKIIIAFLLDRIVMNSPFKVNYSLLKALQNNEEFTSKYEICIYNMDYFEKNESDPVAVNMLLDLDWEIVVIPPQLQEKGYYHSHLNKALYLREQIINAGTDILLTSSAGYDINDFLVSTRVAPKQIFWSHGNFEYDVPNIDRRITHGTVPDGKFVFFHFSVQRDYSDYKSQGMIAEAEKIRSKYGQETVILGSIGRLVKIDSLEYLEVVAKLLKMNPNAIYLACGSGNIESISEKLESLEIEDRFIFVGFVEAKIYVNVLDIYLDTFPHHGGESVREAQMAGCCVATLHIESEKGSPDLRSMENDTLLKRVNYQLEKLDEEWLNNEGFIHQVISFASLNTDAYIGIVDFFIKHSNYRQIVKNVFKTYTPEIISYKEFLEVIGFE